MHEWFIQYILDIMINQESACYSDYVQHSVPVCSDLAVIIQRRKQSHSESELAWESPEFKFNYHFKSNPVLAICIFMCTWQTGAAIG